jgi:Fe-S cluster assembly protein SufD
MLSDDAIMDAKPELEIFADDVKCSHGATVGDIDEAALFYLRARGIDSGTARQMLIEAFLGEVLERLPEGSVKDGFAKVMEERMSVGHQIRTEVL